MVRCLGLGHCRVMYHSIYALQIEVSKWQQITLCATQVQDR